MNPNEEVTKALLEWKHKSIFKVDWANMFSPSVELWKMNDNIFGSIEDLLNYKNKNTKQEVEKAVHLLWLEDEQFIPKKEIAAYLGKL
jgi:D-serine dehydratase